MLYVLCPHATKIDGARSTCARGHHGGSPTFGQCVNACPEGLGKPYPLPPAPGARAMRPPESIPDDFDPAVERRRGGCCDPPRATQP